MTRVKYDVQLDNIPDPVKGKAGELSMQAGQAEGNANAIEGKRVADAISFLGTTGLSAYKGKLESDLDAEIKGTLSKLEGGPEDKARRQNLVNVADDIASFADNGPTNAPEIKQFEESITRFVRAQQQGTLNREQVIERIAAEVKKASALMPGWASDFRKLAAERTGISNIDVYGINKLLTQQSASEKQAERLAAANMKYIEDVAKWAGVPPTGVTPELQRAYFTATQRKNSVEQAKQTVEWEKLGREETDRALTQVLTTDIGAELSGLYASFARGIELNGKGDATSWQQSKQWAQEFDGQLSQFLFKAKTRINNALRPQTITRPDGTVATVPAISSEAANKMTEQLEKQVNDAKKRLTEAGGLNFYNSLIEVSKGQVELMQNNFLISNQYLSNLRNLGILQGGQLYQAYIVNRKAFEAQHGKPMVEAFDRAFGSPQGAAIAGRTVGSVLDARPDQLALLRTQDPDGFSVAFKEHKNAFLNLPKQQEPFEFNSWAKQGKFLAAASNFQDYRSLQNLKEIREGLDHPAMFTYMRDRSITDKATAFMPFAVKLERSVVSAALPMLTEKLAALNDENLPAIQQGAPTIGVRVNALTGLLEVYEAPGKTPARRKFAEGQQPVGDQWNATAPALMGPDYNPAMSRTGKLDARWYQERGEQLKEVRKQVELLNENALLAHSLSKYLGDAPIPAKTFINRIYQMFSTGNKEGKLFEGAAVDVLKIDTDGSYRRESNLRGKIGNPEAEPPVTINDLVKQ